MSYKEKYFKSTVKKTKIIKTQTLIIMHITQF